MPSNSSNAPRAYSFCKAKAVCRKRAEYNLELARYDFEMPATLEDDEIAAILINRLLHGICHSVLIGILTVGTAFHDFKAVIFHAA